MCCSQLLRPGLTSCAVLHVNITGFDTSHPYAFVLVLDETVARTALLFDGMEICGCAVQLRRPHEYCSPPDGDSGATAPVLDVSVLHRIGMLSSKRETHGMPMHDMHDASLPVVERTHLPPRPPPARIPAGIPGPAGATPKFAPKPMMRGLRHLYLGNLPVGHRSLQDVTELVTCLCTELVSYSKDLGPAMVDAAEVQGGWVVEMQSPELALDAQNCLRQTVLADTHLSVYLTFSTR